MRDRTDMVLMRMRDDQANQPVFPLRKVGGVRHHDFYFGVLTAAEADATIDGKPFAIAPV